MSGRGFALHQEATKNRCPVKHLGIPLAEDELGGGPFQGKAGLMALT